MLDLADLCEHLHKQNDATRFRALHQEMADIVDEQLGIRAWFARAYDDSGQPVGVQSERYHKIGLNTQTWAVIGRIGAGDRARQAMESAHAKLNTPFGVALMWPAYNGANSACAGPLPSIRRAERGHFLPRQCVGHRAPAGHVALGDPCLPTIGKFSWRGPTRIISPWNLTYTARTSAGRSTLSLGAGATPELTGAAAWTIEPGRNAFPGRRADLSGLRATPCVPSQWDGFKDHAALQKCCLPIEVKTRVHVCEESNRSG